MVRPSNSVSKRYLFFSPVFQNVWAAIQEIFICIFDDENEQYFAVNNIISGSVTIHFHIAFRHQFPVRFDPHLWLVRNRTNSDSFVLNSSCDWQIKVGWPRLSLLHCKIWSQCNPVEGMECEEATLYLKSNNDCAVFASQERLFQSIAPLYLKLRFRKFVYGLGSARSVSIFLRL